MTEPSPDATDTDLLDRVVRATKELIRADGDASWLSAEEIDALTSNGCAVWEDGHLLFTEDWAESFDRAWNGQ